MKILWILQAGSMALSLIILVLLFCTGGKAGIGGCAVLLLFCTGFSIFQIGKQQRIMDFLIRDNKKKRDQDVKWNKEDEERLELLRKRMNLSTLQMQINPHFLYNTLDTIRGQALLNQQKDIAAMTEKLSRFFRYSISNKEDMVKVQEELNHIQDYYYIQKQRFGERFEMELKVESEEIYEYYMPKLILQPLMENAIAHGLEKVTRKGIVTIEIFATEKKVAIYIVDNGRGMNEAELEKMNERLRLKQVKVSSKQGKGNGIAIYNVNSRIQLTFGEEYGIHYQSVENVGTRAIVTLPKVDDFTRVHYEKLFAHDFLEEKD